MPAVDYQNIQSVNTYINPLQSDGQLIHALNVINFPQGAISKRGGYRTYLNNPDNQPVNGLFSFPFQNGTQLYTYRQSGTNLFTSTQGTANWTPASLGTNVIANSYIGNAVFNNILAVGDGVNHLMTSTDGTTFTTPGSAPIAQYMAVFHNRLYTTDGTSSNVQYSTANDPTNWLSSGTSDSSLLVTTSPGANTGLFVAGDRLAMAKNRGNMFNWDDTTLVDNSTIFGPTSPKSIAQIDDYWFYVHQLGIFGYDGATKSVLSNPIQRMFYNRLGVNVSGTNLINSGNALGAAYWWDYLAVVGNINDDFTGKIVKNAIIKYDYQKNAFVYWQFADFPTAISSYFDNNAHQELIFGNASGQCFQYDPGATSDNGAPISTEMVFMFTFASQSTGFSPTSAAAITGSSWQKKWNFYRAFLNPGCEINVQFAFSDSMDPQRLRWSDSINTRQQTGPNDFWQFSDGSLEIRFPNSPNNLPRSRFLFIRFYENSDSSQWSLYGQQVDADPQIVG